jgi:hypothetical protein
MRQLIQSRLRVLTALFGFVVSSCGSSTEIPTVAEDPWAPPEAPVEDAGRDASDEHKPPCGNGGDCNPDNLGGETCPGLGMGDGTLACDPMTCTYDTSMCEGSTGMGNGGNGSTGTGSGMGNNGMAGAGSDQPPLFGGGNMDPDGGVPFFGGNFFGGAAGMNGNGDNQGTGGNTPQFFGGNFFGGANAEDGGTPFFGGGFFGGNFFGGGNNDQGNGAGNEDPMDAGI